MRQSRGQEKIQRERQKPRPRFNQLLWSGNNIPVRPNLIKKQALTGSGRGFLLGQPIHLPSGRRIEPQHLSVAGERHVAGAPGGNRETGGG